MNRLNRTSTWIVSLSCLVALAACQGTGTSKTTTEAETARPEKAAANAADTAKPAKAVEAVMVHDAAQGKKVTGDCPPNSKYKADGLKSLVDGKMGSEDYQDIEWMGWWYEDKPFDVTIDLGKLVAIKDLAVHTLTANDVWIFYPRKIEFEVSTDGKTFKNVATVKPTKEQLETDFADTAFLKATDLNAQGRYLRVKAQRYGELPEWHIGHGGADGYEGQAWLFIDEILVNRS